MQAIILAGGQGTRLRPLTYTIPKPMLPVANRPALGHTIMALHKAGCREAIVTTNYLAEQVAEGLHALPVPFPVRCVREDKPLGTAGCVKNVIEELDDEFIVIQGDAVADLDYEALIDFHHAKNADVTITVMRVQDTREFGIVAMDEERRILRFQEKPRPEEAFSDLANAGFYVIKKKVFDDVPADQQYDFSRQLFPLLMEQGARFFAFPMQGYWVDIGRIQHYIEANVHCIQGRSDIAQSTRVAESTRLVPPFVIGTDTIIADNCTIGPNVVIGNDCIVGPGTHISGSVLYNEVVVGAAAQLNDCVVASGSHLRDRVTVEPMVAIGEGCVIGVGAQVAAYSRVGPRMPIADGTLVEGAVSPRFDQVERLKRAVDNADHYRLLSQEQRWVCALLGEYGEMTARSLAELGTIPYSRIHSTLHSLEEQGMVLSTPDVPKRYALTREEPFVPEKKAENAAENSYERTPSS
jgi:mannose-1-phosphate guanylyltransferase/phosphomannomutase